MSTNLKINKFQLGLRSIYLLFFRRNNYGIYGIQKIITLVLCNICKQQFQRVHDKKLCCCREHARCFVSSSQLQQYNTSSSVFLQRDYVHSADYGVERCPVRHTPVAYCVETYPQTIFTVGVGPSHTILVFTHPTVWQYSDGDSLTAASNAGGMKNRDFRPIHRFISEMIQ